MSKENLKELDLLLKSVFEDAVDVVVVNAYEELKDREKIKGQKDDDYREVIDNVNRSINSYTLRRIKAIFTLLSEEEIIEVLNNTLFNKEISRKECMVISEELCALVYDLFEQTYGGDMLLDACSFKGNFLAYAVQRMNKEGAFKSIESFNKNFNDCQIVNMIGEILKRGNEATACAYNEDFLKNNQKTFCNQGFVIPPFGVRLLDYDEQVKSMYEDIVFTNRNSNEWLYIDKLINVENIVKDRNKTIAVVTLKALYSNYDKEYRNRLIQDGLIEGIIELPVGAISGASVKTAILILSRGNKSIKMLDASNCYTRNRNTIKINNQEIYNNYKNNSVVIDNKECLKLNRLIPSQIILEDDYEGKQLKEIANVLVGCQYTKKEFIEYITDNNEQGYILTSSEIENGIINWKLLNKINYLDNKMLKYTANKDDIILTSKSTKVKIAVVDADMEKPVIITGSMLIIRLKDSKYNPTFIKGFLESDRGQKVLASIQKSSATISTISASDLMEIKIPSISNQDGYSKKYNELLSQIATYKALLEKCENELKNLMEEYK